MRDVRRENIQEAGREGGRPKLRGIPEAPRIRRLHKRQSWKQNIYPQRQR